MISLRIPLNPIDYMVFSGYRALESRGQVLGFTSMMLDIEGEIEPERLQEALRRVMKLHPATACRIGFSRFTSRPFWTGSDELADPEDVAFSHIDLRNDPAWLETLHHHYEQRMAIPVEFSRPPAVYLDYYTVPRGRGHICLRWPHELMDGEGGMLLMEELARAGSSRGSYEGLPDTLLPDDVPIEEMGGGSFLDQLRILWEGRALYRPYLNTRCPPLSTGSGVWKNDFGISHQVFGPDEVSLMRSHARRLCPPGPALYSRYLLGCVIRAVHRAYVTRGIEPEVYPFSFPTSVRNPGPRPLPGNFLAWLPLHFRRDQVLNHRALATELHRQLTRHLEGRTAGIQWALCRLLAKLPSRQHQGLLLRRVGLQPDASGFSYYSDSPIKSDSLLGARITNLWAVAANAAPPGLNPVFSVFRERMNFSMTWSRSWISDEAVSRLTSDILEEALCGFDDMK